MADCLVSKSREKDLAESVVYFLYNVLAVLNVEEVQSLILANERVVDAFGGYCNTPSKYLPASAPVKAAANTTTAAANTTAANTTAANTTAANTTAAANTTTRILAAAAATTTTAAATTNTTWSIELFINPDPTAAA